MQSLLAVLLLRGVQKHERGRFAALKSQVEMDAAEWREERISKYEPQCLPQYVSLLLICMNLFTFRFGLFLWFVSVLSRRFFFLSICDLTSRQKGKKETKAAEGKSSEHSRTDNKYHRYDRTAALVSFRVASSERCNSLNSFWLVRALVAASQRRERTIRPCDDRSRTSNHWK
jgi:hypothetical protein